MQKLPEASDRKKEWHKEKGNPDKRRKIILFQQWPAEWQHLANEWRMSLIRFWTMHWLALSLVAAVSVNSTPKYKKLGNGPIKLRTKTLDLDKLPKRDTL